jgi:hypothetical protein
LGLFHCQSPLHFQLLKGCWGSLLIVMNMGGGLPAHSINKTCDIDVHAQEIIRYLHEDFSEENPLEIIMEHGVFFGRRIGCLSNRSGTRFTEIACWRGSLGLVGYRNISWFNWNHWRKSDLWATILSSQDWPAIANLCRKTIVLGTVFIG